METTFETECCTRCGGGGQYSYCAMWGTRCFRCHGKGTCYSKRGAAAVAYLQDLRTVTASEIKVGWLLFQAPGPLTRFKSAWYTVTDINPEGTRVGGSMNGGPVTWVTCVELTTRVESLNTFPTEKVQAVPNAARLEETRQLALAYQATLTKQGKPAKTKNQSTIASVKLNG